MEFFVLKFVLFFFLHESYAKSIDTAPIPLKVIFSPKRIVIENKININQAAPKQIAGKIKGLGPKKARAIVKYRRKYGLFTSLESVAEVKGIGLIFFNKNKKQFYDLFYLG
jgi:competence ComEA-like helix-hairpin-helix protein